MTLSLLQSYVHPHIAHAVVSGLLTLLKRERVVKVCIHTEDWYNGGTCLRTVFTSKDPSLHSGFTNGMKKPPFIIKASGDRVRFSRQKLIRSLRRSGATASIANSVADKVASKIVHDKTTTEDIYGRAYQLLRKMKEQPIASRYSLKKAIMALGPTGYPFEQFLGEIFKRRGYQVQVGVTVQGMCTTHEIDVIAIKENVHALVEAKFHNQTGIYTDVKIPLYIHSRFEDVREKLLADGDTHDTHEPWIVTNTHFTSSAIEYGECKGLKLLGWRYPESGGLETMIEEAGLHPITCLSSLSTKEKNDFLKNNVVLCQDLLENQEIFRQFGIKQHKANALKREASAVCSGR